MTVKLGFGLTSIRLRGGKPTLRDFLLETRWRVSEVSSTHIVYLLLAYRTYPPTPPSRYRYSLTSYALQADQPLVAFKTSSPSKSSTLHRLRLRQHCRLISFSFHANGKQCQHTRPRQPKQRKRLHCLFGDGELASRGSSRRIADSS